MPEQTNIDHKDKAHSAKVRSTNHVRPHPANSTKTLMRRALAKPVVSSSQSSRHIKARAAIYHETIKPSLVRTVQPARLERVSQIQRSQFISHLAKPDTRPFVQPSQPIKSILSKPRLEAEEASIDNLLHRAMEKLSNEVESIEQIPVRTMQRFTRSLVANRFNGIALD
jgi:hypothetical protein